MLHRTVGFIVDTSESSDHSRAPWRQVGIKPFQQEENKISKKIPFGIAGDWCPPSQDKHYNGNGQRVEDAYLSGIECSKSLIKQYFN